MHKVVEDFEVVFDPVPAISHFLAPLHFAVLGALPQNAENSLTSSDIARRLFDEFEVEEGVDLTAEVIQALTHLVGADLIERRGVCEAA